MPRDDVEQARPTMRLEFFKPRYWFTWLGLGIMRSLEIMPVSMHAYVGSAIGYLVRHLPLPYVRIARRNIELCLPHLTTEERAKVLDAHCRSLGISLCETAMTWWSSNARVRSLATIEGFEHIEAALAKGRGVILVGGHFTTIEITARILGTLVPLTVLYRPQKNALLSHVMYQSFCTNGNPIPYDDIRAMIRALKNQGAVWYAPDQSYRNKGAAMVNFFGIPAATNTATSRLARISGAPVIYYFSERCPSGKLRVVIDPPLEDFPSEDPIADAQRLNHILEKQILKIPEQYLWMHRRFKGLPHDYPDYYGRDTRKRTPVEAPR